MTKITLLNGLEYDVNWVEEEPVHYDGIDRRGLLLRFNEQNGINADNLFKDFNNQNNTEIIKVANLEKNGVEHVSFMPDYCILMGVSVNNIPSDEVNGIKAHTEYEVQLARKTSLEKQNDEIINALQKAGIEV